MKWILIVYFLANMLANIALIDVQSKPITRGRAVFQAIMYMALIYGCYVYIK